MYNRVHREVCVYIHIYIYIGSSGFLKHVSLKQNT